MKAQDKTPKGGQGTPAMAIKVATQDAAAIRVDTPITDVSYVDGYGAKAKTGASESKGVHGAEARGM